LKILSFLLNEKRTETFVPTLYLSINWKRKRDESVADKAFQIVICNKPRISIHSQTPAVLDWIEELGLWKSE